LGEARHARCWAPSCRNIFPELTDGGLYVRGLGMTEALNARFNKVRERPRVDVGGRALAPRAPLAPSELGGPCRQEHRRARSLALQHPRLGGRGAQGVRIGYNGACLPADVRTGARPRGAPALFPMHPFPAPPRRVAGLRVVAPETSTSLLTFANNNYGSLVTVRARATRSFLCIKWVRPTRRRLLLPLHGVLLPRCVCRQTAARPASTTCWPSGTPTRARFPARQVLVLLDRRLH